MKRINIFLDDQEERILKALINKYGGKPSQTLKNALKFKYDKSFPLYAVKGEDIKSLIPEEEFTPEQICEMLKVGAKVSRDNFGNPTCIIPGAHPGITTTIPLSTASEEYQKMKKRKQKEYEQTFE